MSEEFTDKAKIQLLRAQQASAQEKLGRALYRQKRAEDLLSKYLTAHASVAWGQAVASGADVLHYAEAMLGALSEGRPATSDATATAALDLLRQYLEVLAVDTTQTTTPDAVLALAQQQLPVVAQQWQTRVTAPIGTPPPGAPPTDTPTALAAYELLRQYLAALQISAAGVTTSTDLIALAQQQLPLLPPRLVAPPSVSPAPPVTPPPAVTVVASAPALSRPELPEAAVEAWRVIGREPSWEKAEPLFVQTTGHAPPVFREMVDVLVAQNLLSLFKAPVAKRHEAFCNPRLFELTATGETLYQPRFGLAPVTLATFLGKYHVTPAATLTWWLIRATRNAILSGQLLTDNPFGVEVFDLADGIPAGYQREYGECRNPDKEGDEQCSVPDLFVTLQARGAETQRICVECERGRYANQALKRKLRWTMHNYGQAGFAGVYYVAPAVPEARVLQRALLKLSADLRNDPRQVARGMLAIFTFDALADHWLPSPAMVDRWAGTMARIAEAEAAATAAGTDPAAAVAALGINPREMPLPMAASALCRLKHRQRAGNIQAHPGEE
ncbi:MAG TPA: hypothetical protein PKH77_22600 [Anaerolineae bacterium]|nr:hypothetical protein [Anaerolineae bacterium]